MSEERVHPHGEQTDRIIRELVREVIEEQKCVFGENDEVRDMIIFLNESQRLIRYFRIEYLRGQGHIDLTEVIPGTNP